MTTEQQKSSNASYFESILKLVKTNTFQTCLFVIGSAVLAVVSSFGTGTPNNLGSWIAVMLTVYQIVLNVFQALARKAFAGTDTGQTLEDIATVMEEIRTIGLAVLSHQKELNTTLVVPVVPVQTTTAFPLTAGTAENNGETKKDEQQQPDANI